MISHFLRILANATIQSIIEYIGQNSAGEQDASITLTTPSGATTGDLLVVFGYSANAGTSWSISGGTETWTITNQTNTTAPRLCAFYTVYNGSTASFTLSQTGSAYVGGTIMAFRNAGIDVYSAVSTAADPIVIASATASLNNSVQLITAGGNTNSPASTPNGFTQIVLNEDANQPDWGVYYKTINSGSTGTVSVDMLGSANTSGMQVVMCPTPSYIGMSSASQSGASVSCSVPSNAQAGDLLVAVSTQTGSSTTYTMTPPSGWTESLDDTGRWAGYLPSWDGTTSSYTFTKSNSASNPAVVILAFRNAAFDVQGTLSTSTASPAAPSVTLSNNGSIVVACFSSLVSTATYTTPTGYTEIADLSLGLAVSYKTNIASGATGTVSATVSTGNARAFLIGIKYK